MERQISLSLPLKGIDAALKRDPKFHYPYLLRNYNCSIDRAKVILATKDRRIPPSYKGILKELGATQHFDEAFRENISHWASLRNILAHEYLDIRWKPIKQFIQTPEQRAD